MDSCKFTIITVCYNAEAFIEATIRSVLSQTYTRVDYIIKDGNSTDSTIDIVRRLTDQDERVTLMQGRDRGIYDAMNIAVAKARGEYVLFLNAGDVLHGKTLLRNMAELMERTEADVYYGNVIQIDTVEGVPRYAERFYGTHSVRKVQFAVGRCLCHQSMLVRRELFLQKDFDIGFHVCADREWQLYFLFENKKFFSYLPVIVSDVLADGYSSEHVGDLEAETRKCIRRYCKEYLWVYDGIMILKKSALLKKLLRKMDALLQTKGSGQDG